MAFPNYANLTDGDNFTRANESPVSNGGRWTAFGGSGLAGSMKVVSNAMKAVGAAGTYCGAYIKDRDYSTSELAIKIGLFPSGAVVYGKIRLAPTGSLPVQDPSQNCYFFSYNESVTGGWIMYRSDAGVGTQLGSSVTSLTNGAGDQWGFEGVGSSLTLYRKLSAGSFTTIMTRSDATYTHGYSGLVVSDPGTTLSLDDFAIGGVVNAAQGSSTVSLTNTRVTAGVPKKFAASAVALTNTRVTAAFRQTFVASTVALVNSRVTAGFRKTFVASTVSLIDTITSGGSRKALGAATVALVNTRVTSAVRKAISSSLVALVNARTSAARILARSSSTTSEVVGVVSSGLISGSTVTHLGASTVALVDVRVTSATRKTFGASTVPLVNSRVSGSRFTAKGNPGTRAEVVGITTSGTVFSHPTWSGSSVVNLAGLCHSKGRVTAKTGSTVNPVVSIVTGSRAVLRTGATVALHVSVSSSGRTQAAGITVINQADTIYLGSRHVDAVYVGSVRAWP